MELSDDAAKAPPSKKPANSANIKINLKADSKATTTVAVAPPASANDNKSRVVYIDDGSDDGAAPESSPTAATTSVQVADTKSPADPVASTTTATPATPATATPAPATNATSPAAAVATATTAATSPAVAKPPQTANDIIKMSTNEMAIHISNKSPRTFTSANCNFTRKSTKAALSSWDMIIIHHNQKYTKPDILAAIFRITQHVECYPVAYRPSKRGDLFLMRNCQAALHSLFNAGLRLLMDDGQQIELIVKLDVAPFKLGQIEVRSKLLQLLQKRRQQLIKVDTLPKVLDLSSLRTDPELAEIALYLGSATTLGQVNWLLSQHHHNLLGGVRGLKLADNQLRRLGTFRQWPRTYVHLLDLSNNEIEKVKELEGLEKIVFIELIVTGNPFTRGSYPNYFVDLKRMFPSLKTINGTDITDLVITPPKNAAKKPATSTTSAGLVIKTLPTPAMVLNPAATVLPPSKTLPKPVEPNATPQSAATSNAPQPVPAPTPVPLPVPAPAAAKIVLNPLSQMVINPMALCLPQEPQRSASPPRPVPAPKITATTLAPASATTSASAASGLQLKVKSFATIGAAPLPPDAKALAGSLCGDAGDVLHSDACNRKQSAAQLMIKYKTSTMWHRVVVNHHGDHRKADVLDSLWRTLGACDMQPCYYTEFAKCDTFFVRNAYEAVERLVAAKLLLRMREKNVFCTLTLQLNVATYKAGQIDAAEQIHAAIGKCFSMADRTLDLSRFAEHAELAEVEVRLSNAATLSTVLMQAARRYLTNIHRLRLAGNGLVSASGMRPLTWMKELRLVDLSDNSLESVEALSAMPSLPTIEEFSMRGNPLPASLEPMEYVAAVKKHLPHLRRLDGCVLEANGCSVTQQNYLCSLDGHELVEQFCELYFEQMDGLRAMSGLYLDRALMTMSCSLMGAAGNAATLHNYSVRTRNLWRQPLPAAANTVLHGGTEIETRWKSFGVTEHDYGSFTIDLVHWTPLVAVFTVNGMYREQASHEDPLDDAAVFGSAGRMMFGFVRTFVLRKADAALGMFGHSSRWLISNEQVLIYQPSMLQLSCAFAKPPVASLGMAEAAEGEAGAEEKDGLVVVMQEITQLVALWCKRFLEQADWQLRAALELYVSASEERTVPDEAYVELAADKGVAMGVGPAIPATSNMEFL